MAGTIIEYLTEYGKDTFAQRPFNEVDSLVLCQLSYLKFDTIVPSVRENGKSVTLTDICNHENFDKLFSDTRYEKDNRALFSGVLQSRRFAKIKLNCYINLIEQTYETQFSAITFLLENSTIFVAYRGTDETIVGWKEDFNMAFQHPVPGQSYSVKYLNIMARKVACPILVGGHSKGGNLALYASMYCLSQIQKNIAGIYCMDGPGFRPEVLDSERFDLIKDKIIKILPESSFVGLIFENQIQYEVIESRSFGLNQHNPYNWRVKDGEFVKLQKISDRNKRMDNTINEWILSLDEAARKLFINSLFQIISASKAENLIDFTSDWRKSVNGMISALKEMDEQTKSMLKEIIKSLFEIGRVHAKKETKIGKKKLKMRKSKEEAPR